MDLSSAGFCFFESNCGPGRAISTLCASGILRRQLFEPFLRTVGEPEWQDYDENAILHIYSIHRPMLQVDLPFAIIADQRPVLLSNFPKFKCGAEINNTLLAKIPTFLSNTRLSLLDSLFGRQLIVHSLRALFSSHYYTSQQIGYSALQPSSTASNILSDKDTTSPSTTWFNLDQTPSASRAPLVKRYNKHLTRILFFWSRCRILTLHCLTSPTWLLTLSNDGYA